MIDRRKLVLAGLSAGIVAIFIFIRFYGWASTTSLLATFWVYLLITVGVPCLLFAFFTESLLPFNKSDEKKIAAWVLALPILTILFYTPVIWLTDMDAALRIARYGLHEYDTFTDMRTDFKGLLRIKNGSIDAATSVYYPGDDESHPEIYYAIRDTSGIFYGIYLDSIFHLKHEFIDRVSADKREGKPVSGFLGQGIMEQDRCAGVLSDGRKQYHWENIDEALCLIYVPPDDAFVSNIRWRMRILLPVLLLGHFSFCLFLMRRLR